MAQASDNKVQVESTDILFQYQSLKPGAFKLGSACNLRLAMRVAESRHVVHNSANVAYFHTFVLRDLIFFLPPVPIPGPPPNPCALPVP